MDEFDQIMSLEGKKITYNGKVIKEGKESKDGKTKHIPKNK